jgi:pimeloyl-ACP methyl ester carboxylesterase
MEKRIHEIKKLQSILYIYSQADTWVPIEMGYRFLRNTLIPSSLYVVNNAEHAQIMKSPDQEAYKKAILDYFNNCTSNFMTKG